MGKTKQAKRRRSYFFIFSGILLCFLRGIQGLSGSFAVDGGPKSASAGVNFQEQPYWHPRRILLSPHQYTPLWWLWLVKSPHFASYYSKQCPSRATFWQTTDQQSLFFCCGQALISSLTPCFNFKFIGYIISSGLLSFGRTCDFASSS